MQIKTSELTGPALDYAVALARGVSFTHFRCPSEDWKDGGPLLAQFQAAFLRDGADYVAVLHETGATGFGPTHLIAACRAIVAAKLGDTVDVPEELCHV